nr:MAG TPA: hypothetical protein [Caudoviricetes sp.]
MPIDIRSAIFATYTHMPTCTDSARVYSRKISSRSSLHILTAYVE